MAAASCNLLHLPLSETSNFLSPLPPPASSLSLPRRPFPISASSAGPLPPIVPSPAVDPSLRYANILHFQSGYNVQIVVDEGESEEVLLRRFRREVSKAGVIQECKRRRFFENKQEEKKRKAREAGRRNRRRRSGPRFNSTPQSDDAPKKAREDADDNWDLPEGGLPY